MNSKGNYEKEHLCQNNIYVSSGTIALREKKILESETKVSDPVVQSFKNYGTGKTRNKKTHLQPKKKKRK